MSGLPQAYMRMPRSPTHNTVAPLSPITFMAPWVTVQPGPSIKTLRAAAGTWMVPSASVTVMALSAR